MNVLAFAALGLTGALLAVFVKRTGTEYGLLVSAFCVCALIIALMPQITVIVAKIRDMTGLSETGGEGFSVLLRAVGIGYICQFSSDLCVDAGENAIASKIELAGKISILVLTLPVIGGLIETVRGML